MGSPQAGPPHPPPAPVRDDVGADGRVSLPPRQRHAGAPAPRVWHADGCFSRLQHASCGTSPASGGRPTPWGCCDGRCGCPGGAGALGWPGHGSGCSVRSEHWHECRRHCRRHCWQGPSHAAWHPGEPDVPGRHGDDDDAGCVRAGGGPDSTAAPSPVQRGRRLELPVRDQEQQCSAGGGGPRGRHAVTPARQGARDSPLLLQYTTTGR